MRFLAIIPARGGSKGLKDKNILSFNGVPLIEYVTKKVLGVRGINDIVVTSDSNNILKAVEHLDVIVKKREISLAQDDSLMVDVVLDVLCSVGFYDYLILLQPTSPLRDSTDIETALNLVKDKKLGSLVSVVESEEHPYKMLTKKEGLVHPLYDWDSLNLSRQNLPLVYRQNGAIYIIEVQKFKEKRKFIFEDTFLYEMPLNRSVDIDSYFDFKFAEFLAEKGL